MKTLQRVLASLTICLFAMAASAQTRPVVQFIATGGTIAMKIDPVTRGVVPAISGDDLMQTVPGAGKYATIASHAHTPTWGQQQGGTASHVQSHFTPAGD